MSAVHPVHPAHKSAAVGGHAKPHAKAKDHHDDTPPPPPRPVGPGELSRSFFADHELEAKPRAAKGHKGGRVRDLCADHIREEFDLFVSWLLETHDVTCKPGVTFGQPVEDKDKDDAKADADDEKD